MKRERKFNNEFYIRKAKLIMTKNYSYIPNKENLFILLKSEYENIIRQLKQNKEMSLIGKKKKKAIRGSETGSGRVPIAAQWVKNLT